MKIGIVCFNLEWQAGGARLIFSLARELKKAGAEVIIYAPKVNPAVFSDLQKGLTIREVLPKRPLNWTRTPKGIFQKIIHKFKEESLRVDTAKRIAEAMDKDFDVVNLHDFAYRVGIYYKKIHPSAKIVWTENDPPFMYLPKENPLFDILSRLYNRVMAVKEKKYFEGIDKVAVLDFYNRDWALHEGLAPTVVRSGVDYEHFYAPVKSIGAKGKRIDILGVGALNKYRRFEDIVHAVGLLRKSGYDARAVVVSKDIWGETGYRKQLEELLQKENLREYVDFRFEGMTNEELRAAYARSDFFVLPMYLPPPRNGYGWGLSNFEAMAAGLPLIICRTSTATEVLTDGKNVVLTDPMRPDQIAEKIKFLVEHPPLYRSIAEAGQMFVKENISWEKYMQDMLRLFEG